MQLLLTFRRVVRPWPKPTRKPS